MGVGPFAKKKTWSLLGILDSLWQGKPGIVTQVTNNNNTFLRSRHCLVIFSVYLYSYSNLIFFNNYNVFFIYFPQFWQGNITES